MGYDILEKKELALLRKAVDEAEIKAKVELLNSEIIGNIINIVEDFLRKKQLICYGGTAVNNILPKEEQFYDYSIEMADYDFFSNDALKDTKELADIYYKNGFEDVEAKAGVHEGTFKVFVNYIPVADITQLNNVLFKSLKKDAIEIDGIFYTPPNFLRMSMYLELSRPAGDVSRWEKILKRLILLNKNYPIKGKNCEHTKIQRTYEGNKKSGKKIFQIVRDSFIDQGLVFFGGYANLLYSRYMPENVRKKIKAIPDFDVLSEDPLKSAILVREKLNKNNFQDVKILKAKELGEVIPNHYEIKVNNDTVAFIYETIACHSYNTIKIDGKKIKIATIDTMLSFYLAFLYANRLYFDTNRILCMAELLFKVQIRHRLAQKGLLKRFSTNCYGTQKTLTTIRTEKTNKFKKLKSCRKKNKKCSQKLKKEYEYNFLRYIPTNNKTQKIVKNKKK